ncbi:MAG: DUF2889 domain-containing protein [Desulfobacteraceae bacterium]|nr:MAG: DUF2889 domain-containing protein [Desulfobacteraceae bacterium]
MTRLIDLVKNAPVHERRLEFRTYPLEDDRLIVEGWLRDERLVPGYHRNGESRPTGVVHWMCVRLLIGGWPVTILDAEAEMPDIPHELCPTTLESVKRIVGLSIVSGYSEEVHKRLGGVQGCAHLTHLIVTMGPAALHGYWTHQSRQRRPIPRFLDEFQGLTTLINSCKLWKEDGPLMQMIRETLEKPEEKSQ